MNFLPRRVHPLADDQEARVLPVFGGLVQRRDGGLGGTLLDVAAGPAEPVDRRHYSRDVFGRGAAAAADEVDAVMLDEPGDGLRERRGVSGYSVRPSCSTGRPALGITLIRRPLFQ